MYGFPRLHLSKKAIAEAKKQGVEPDFFYCKKLVEETGIMTVPGSGFGQKKGEYHLRITNLVTPTDKMKEVLHRLRDFNTKFNKEYK